MSLSPSEDAALRAVARSIIGDSPLAIGKRYEHPEDGVIKIVSGYWTDPIYGRVSNFWYWTVEATGETHNGYGSSWPEVTEEEKEVVEKRKPLTHAAVGCGDVIKDYDTIIFIGDLSEVDCEICKAKLAAMEEERARERAATALRATGEALDALKLAARGQDAPGHPRVDWNQVARDALTEALDALAVPS